MYIITYVLYLYIEKHITITEMENGILIGGQALIQLGSSRGTIDTDYLVNISDARTFIHDEEDIDSVVEPMDPVKGLDLDDDDIPSDDDEDEDLLKDKGGSDDGDDDDADEDDFADSDNFDD